MADFGDILNTLTIAAGSSVRRNAAGTAFEAYIPTDVSKVGTPVNNQIGVWTGDGTLEGDTALTFDTATDTLAIVNILASGDVSVADEVYGIGWNGSLEVPTKNAVYDKIQTLGGSGDVSKVGTPVDNQIGVWTGDGTLEGDTALTFDTTTDTLTLVNLSASGDISVADEVYGIGWNGSLEVPTKNAVYDKIEAIPALSDGDKGDIIVSASGAVWTIDAESVTYAKIQNVSQTDVVLGRDSVGAGDIEEITPANLKTMLSLSNVDNTSDANKPVSTAQQTALDLKANLAGPTFTGTVTIPSTIGISASADKRFITDAQQTVLGNTSGTNTGDQTSIVGIAGTVAQFNTAITDGDLATGGGTATGTNTGDQTLPVKASGAEIDTGTDDAKFATAKAIEDSAYIKAAYADALVSDTVYGVGWDGVTTIAPSKNAVYDKIQTIIDTDLSWLSLMPILH